GHHAPDRLHHAAAPLLAERAGAFLVTAVPFDGVPQVVGPFAVHRGGLDDRRSPPSHRAHPKHVPQLPDRVLGAATIRPVHHEHVGDLQDAGLGNLNVVAPAGGHDHHGGVGGGGHLDLRLPHADGLHD